MFWLLALLHFVLPAGTWWETGYLAQPTPRARFTLATATLTTCAALSGPEPFGLEVHRVLRNRSLVFQNEYVGSEGAIYANEGV
jgi:hypothetical protein